MKNAGLLNVRASDQSEGIVRGYNSKHPVRTIQKDYSFLQLSSTFFDIFDSPTKIMIA